MSLTKKKKHVSKKNKKDWRKHCDIRDVEEFLEDQRLEERLGKLDTKPDNELFVVDTAGEDAPKDDIEEKLITAKQRKRAKLAEPPKCFQILLPSSKVEDPNKKRNRVNPVGTKKTALSKVTDKRRLEKGIYQKKLEMARKNRKMALEKKKKAKQARQNFNMDMWGEELPENKGIPPTLCEEFVSRAAQLHNVLPERRLRPKPPAPPSVATRAAVEPPHPGVSYNPTFEEHQELLSEVVVHEEKMMKRERHLLRVTTNMFSRVTRAEKEKSWREEMSSGLSKPHNPAENPDSETDDEYKAVNPPVKNKKKDHKTRRKQKERLLELERLRQQKINKKKITDLYRLRKLQTSISKTENSQAETRSKKKEKELKKSETAVPALNKNKVLPKEPDFVPPEALPGDLRHVAPTSNLLKERYESLQRRGALAGAKIMMKKKRKVKSYFKAGHKVTDQEIEKYVNRTAGEK